MARVSWSKLPIGMPNGDLMPHMSARMRRAEVDAAYQLIGGTPALVSWVERSEDNRGTFYTRIWAPGQAKASSVEVAADESVEALLDRLDAGEHAKVISPADDDV